MGAANPGHGRKGAAKVKHLGRKKNYIAHYYGYVWAPRKLRHMLKNNGYPFAQSWAAKHDCLNLLPTK
jgi:hypothetical protein